VRRQQSETGIATLWIASHCLNMMCPTREAGIALILNSYIERGIAAGEAVQIDWSAAAMRKHRSIRRKEISA
jgi:hypothetical protein